MRKYIGVLVYGIRLVIMINSYYYFNVNRNIIVLELID